MVKDETGNKYGFLTAVARDTTIKGDAHWICACDCGTHKVVKGSYLRNGQIRSCGKCSLSKKPVAEDAAFRKAYSRLKYLHFHERGGGDFISYEQFLKLSAADCHYCGSPPSNVRNVKSGKKFDPDHRRSVLNGIDRVDSSVNYQLDNCVPCCYKCNSMKSDRSTEEFLAHIRKIIKHMEK